MKREVLLQRIADNGDGWDVVVIGGGATGLGVAVDAAARGFSVALFEQNDFAKATSSRSTKLVHGGVRYLRNGDVPLVREALHERGRLRRNAPHLVKNQSFIISNYSLWDNFLYTCGLVLYDMLSWGGLSLGRSRYINRDKVIKYLPNVRKEGLKGGVIYRDGQFDDARLAINLAQTCVDKGGCPVNHMTVTGITHDGAGKVSGVKARDNETGREYEVSAACVINAAGIFVDDIMGMDSPKHGRMVIPSQGVHIVLDMKFLRSDYAVMVPKTSDGRVLFAVPWHGRVVVGTTDTVREAPEPEPEPVALEEEIEFILQTAGLYMDHKPARADILSVFAGQRPLAAPQKEGKNTREISRSHKIIVSPHNLITVTGGKWTTYRRMAEDALNKAMALNILDKRRCVTKNLPIHGYKPHPDPGDHLYIYGSDIDALRKLMDSDRSMREKVHPSFEYTAAEVVWAVREEMALTVEDILARRVRLLFIDARAAIEAAPKVARIVAAKRGLDKKWEQRQVASFADIAKNYVMDYKRK